MSTEHTWYSAPDQPGAPRPGDLVYGEALGAVSIGVMRGWMRDQSVYAHVEGTLFFRGGQFPGEWAAVRVRRLTPEELAAYQLARTIQGQP